MEVIIEMKRNIWAEIVKKLNLGNYTIATMESCTGGGITDEITNISGASAVLKESYVTYCNEAKIKQGVPAEVIEKHTVYSPETAIEMARAVKAKANSDIAIGVTGQLGMIDPNNPVDKLNCVWFAIVNHKNQIFVHEVHVPNSERKSQKECVINAVAIALLELV